MIQRVNQVAAEFRKVSNKQMAETTKRTIRENVSINAQLSKMSDKTMELIQENDELRQKEKEMKQHIDMLEFNEKELAKKNSSNQKVKCDMICPTCFPCNTNPIFRDVDLLLDSRSSACLLQKRRNKRTRSLNLKKRADKMKTWKMRLNFIRDKLKALKTN